MTREEATKLLPKVGDVRYEKPVVDHTGGRCLSAAPQRCTVVEVHHEHLWYTVRFENGTKESYKVPRVRDNQGVMN